MEPELQYTKEGRPGGFRLLSLVIRTVFRRLPTSVYLALAMIVALVLGVSGFEDLENPERIASTMTLFIVFFGAVVYRALIEALGITRRFRKEQDVLMQKVFARDDFATDLGRRVVEEESRVARSDS